MYLDINAYVGHWPFKKLKYSSCSGMLERMNRFGVEMAVISSLNGAFYKNTQSANEDLMDEIKSDKRFAGRFIPFAVINPIYAGWQEDLTNCITKMGMKGIRLYPKYHDYEINDSSLFELVRQARDLGVPVSIDIRMVDSRQRSWMDIPKFEDNAPEKYDIIIREWELRNVIPIIREVPDAKYMIVNLANSVRLSDEDTELIKNTDILFDTSGRSLRGDNTLSELMKRFGNSKFAFGTHAPILDYLSGMLRIESLNDSEADAAVKESLRSGNAKRFLNL